MDSGGRQHPAATAPQHGATAQCTAENVGSVMLTAELTRLNTDLLVLCESNLFMIVKRKVSMFSDKHCKSVHWKKIELQAVFLL